MMWLIFVYDVNIRTAASDVLSMIILLKNMFRSYLLICQKEEIDVKSCCYKCFIFIPHLMDHRHLTFWGQLFKALLT